jgi:hypothetical protein
MYNEAAYKKEDKYISGSFSGSISLYMGLARQRKYTENNYFGERRVKFQVCCEVSVQVCGYILIWYVMIWYDMIYDVIWNDIWYDMIWYI